jgi:hypothetical protein
MSGRGSGRSDLMQPPVRPHDQVVVLDRLPRPVIAFVPGLYTNHLICEA